ncbi:hypothetical protein KC352_g25501 [Hortaea werneckii]|uniref:BRO1 domain-containing protein n=1 Tax=Hortaea werneckii EXF-2000 TaxID=1157616 RepID=A0A1Z5SY50_HORWE|nr:hypothetical protein KC358_g479 [Hortaea werneckii]OTA25819.1 hypothetical protein BTJ68_10269 [Hortaea werneckii EXF-2000]KAI6944711.1 hypothetical protein KC341_g619 [Hortaea werneckii]KAI6950769.1 hypothetical protein KC348_g461 [Hortaea werneckii]KAI6982770.1 hypothetical protein KC321_g445 [Hortaea werneckii]
MQPPKQLSEADSRILTQVFDPESGPTKAEVIVDPFLPSDRQYHEEETVAKLRAREREAIVLIEQFEKEKPQTQSKADVFRAAVSILDGIVDQYPLYASARNNRAQLRRWMFGDRYMLCQPQIIAKPDRTSAGSAILEDLKSAVSWASPERSHDAVSPAQGKLLAQAYTQLAAVYYAAAKDLAMSKGAEVSVAEEIMDCSSDGLEEEASRLFYLGGLYRNEMAKALAVHTNPHAKLCGNIVKEAMRKEFASV